MHVLYVTVADRFKTKLKNISNTFQNISLATICPPYFALANFILKFHISFSVVYSVRVIFYPQINKLNKAIISFTW